ncbi:unnamed protein product [Knipowitschia caucasica]|uniref:Galectin n=1 Tax=Knipowitschia caucasica TaxID=637954 RepID=A0AAV2J6U1_KNICA
MAFVAPPGYQPVYNPSIPYLGPIYGGLQPGSSVYIQGSTPEDMTRFRVNLLCGQTEDSDIALHVNPRFDGWDKVVFNTKQDGSWGDDDKIRKMPFRKGENFELVIQVTAEGYNIKVNGQDFHTFEHRIHVAKVQAIQVAGDVKIQTINIIGGGMGGGCPGGDMGGGYPGGNMGGGYPGGNMGGGYPGGNMGGGGYPESCLPGMGGQPVHNPPVPYQGMIPGGLSAKRTIIIRGLLPFGGIRMAINFVVSKTNDIAFHLNPRVKDRTVVRNSKIGGKWGKEERELKCNPFMEGEYFDMSIRCGNQKFKVFVNGQHALDFSHRTKLFNEVDRLEIEGDVQLSYIQF